MEVTLSITNVERTWPRQNERLLSQKREPGHTSVPYYYSVLFSGPISLTHLFCNGSGYRHVLWKMLYVISLPLFSAKFNRWSQLSLCKILRNREKQNKIWNTEKWYFSEPIQLLFFYGWQILDRSQGQQRISTQQMRHKPALSAVTASGEMFHWYLLQDRLLLPGQDGKQICVAGRMEWDFVQFWGLKNWETGAPWLELLFLTSRWKRLIPTAHGTCVLLSHMGLLQVSSVLQQPKSMQLCWLTCSSYQAGPTLLGMSS